MEGYALSSETDRAMRPLVIFLHIPKTGGTTLTDLLMRHYPRTLLYDVDRYGIEPEGAAALGVQMDAADAFCGHFWYGVHRYTSRPYTYITVLRHPVEQVLSWFNFRYQNPRYPRYRGDIEAYLADPAYTLEHSNVQTRFLSGRAEPDLSLAIRHVESDFAAVGVTEWFDASIARMQQVLGWRNIGYTPLNVSTRPRFEHLPARVIQKILDHNRLDMVLYEYVRRRLLRDIDGDGVEVRPRHGVCFWFTGLSGAGKTTVATALQRRLQAAGVHAYVLDADVVRNGLNSDLGFTDVDRKENVRRIAYLAKTLCDAGIHVLVTCIAPFAESRAFAKSLFEPGSFVEVYVDCPVETCMKRDPKGLYERVKQRLISGMTGVDAPYEAPAQPDVVLPTDRWSVHTCVETLLNVFHNVSGR